MFRSTAHGLRTWWTDFSDDILGADLPPSTYAEELDDQPDLVLEYHVNHPHRQPLTPRRLSRAGAVPPRPAHCLSPVRAPDHANVAEPVRS